MALMFMSTFFWAYEPWYFSAPALYARAACIGQSNIPKRMFFLLCATTAIHLASRDAQKTPIKPELLFFCMPTLDMFWLLLTHRRFSMRLSHLLPLIWSTSPSGHNPWCMHHITLWQRWCFLFTRTYKYRQFNELDASFPVNLPLNRFIATSLVKWWIGRRLQESNPVSGA